ncbi:MAG: hypothetical protein ACOZBL_04775 [Patescibacteria group bacterium]
MIVNTGVLGGVVSVHVLFSATVGSIVPFSSCASSHAVYIHAETFSITVAEYLPFKYCWKIFDHCVQAKLPNDNNISRATALSSSPENTSSINIVYQELFTNGTN